VAFTPSILQAAYGVAIDVEQRAGSLSFHRKTTAVSLVAD
jgi:hypothetical protein